MNVVKSVVKAVWPIIYNVLVSYAKKSETQIDDIAIAAANAAIEEWLEDENTIEFN